MKALKNIFGMLAMLALALTCGLAMILSLIETTDMAVATQERIASVQGNARLALIVMLLSSIAVRLLAMRVRFAPFHLASDVPDHSGHCVPVWINTNQVHYMLTGGATGFFRQARRLPGLPFAWMFGPEFHGHVRECKVHSTLRINGRLPA